MKAQRMRVSWGKGGARERADDAFLIKKASEQSGLCSIFRAPAKAQRSGFRGKKEEEL